MFRDITSALWGGTVPCLYIFTIRRIRVYGKICVSGDFTIPSLEETFWYRITLPAVHVSTCDWIDVVLDTIDPIRIRVAVGLFGAGLSIPHHHIHPIGAVVVFVC